MSKVNQLECGYFSLALGLAATGAALFAGGAANAQVGTEVTDPPMLSGHPAPAPSAPAGPQLAPAAPTAANEKVFNLDIEYVDGEIYNPAENRMDKVHLRSYTSPDLPPEHRYIAPEIWANPGDVVRVKLRNRLPADATCAGADHGNVNVPHCFNGTNLHSHGLWVNPSGNGDNVLLSIDPGVSFEYEYAIPSEHPAGTFWYHTHRHGSTALQVSSGMAGALIIKGDRVPTANRPGDLDTLLGDAPDRTFVLQQIQYYCQDASGGIKKNPNRTYRCDPGDVGKIESYDALKDTWGNTGRYTSVNGRILPDFRARQGEVERWRFIHGGVRDTVGIQFRKARRNPLRAGLRLAAEGMERFVDQNCQGDPLPFHLAAADGLTMSTAQRKEVAILQPGYRFDALVVFPEGGSYCVIDTQSTAADSVGGVPSKTRLLGMVQVEGDAPASSASAGDQLTALLVAAAERNMPAGVRQAVIADLRDGLKLTRFVPHKTVSDAEMAGSEVQELTFAVRGNPAEFQVGGQGYEPRAYKPDRLDRKLILGTAQEWRLSSANGSHPYHIHVNPFEVVEVLDAAGNDVSAPTGPGDPNSQYRGLKGAWKDTLWVQNGHKIRIRTRYERYIGEFVLHCHILDHEDKGMMQNVAIVLPGGTPESVNAPENGGHGH
jgi:FtsP/CotA-like multicopper oxidase with cupredoxin domain